MLELMVVVAIIAVLAAVVVPSFTRESRKAKSSTEVTPMLTELSNRAKAALPPGADRVNIYDTPLQVLAGLLAVGFVLTLLVRPLRASARPAPQASAVPSRT